MPNNKRQLYFKFLYLNVTITIKKAITILIKNSSNLVIFKNNKNILLPPVIPPKIILFIETFLLNIRDTDRSNIKSKNIFNKNTKSTYIFIVSPHI